MSYEKVKAAGGPFDAIIQREADAQGVPYDFAHKLIFNESSFNPNAKSPTGPRGLGQFTRATGAAYGLITDEDFFNPEKSIKAAVSHIKDLSAAYKGDMLKVALAYNQGQGRLGNPQLVALDAGDMSKISPEGKLYMERLLDVAGDSPNRKWFDSLGKPEAAEFNKYTQGLAASPKVQRGEYVTPQAFSLGESQEQTVEPSFQRLEIDQSKPQKGTFEGTGEAVKDNLATSALGQLWRNVTIEEYDPLDWVDPTDTSDWTDEDFENIRKEGVDPQYFSFIMSNTRGHRALLPQAIKLAKENMEYERNIASQGTGAQIVGGFAGAAGDPLIYVPIPGIQGKTLVSSVVRGSAYTSAAAVAGEAVRESATGIEGHYGTAAVSGAVLGAGFGAIIDRAGRVSRPTERLDMWDADLEKVLARHDEAALPNVMNDLEDFNEFASTSMRLEARETARNLGQEDASRMPLQGHEELSEMNGVRYTDMPGEPGAVRLADGSIMSATNPFNPKLISQYAAGERAARGLDLGGYTEIGYRLNRSENEAIRGIGSQLFRSTTGTTSGSHGRFGATASDIIERINSQDNLSHSAIVEAVKKAVRDVRYVSETGGRQAKYEMAFRRAAEAIEDTSGTKMAQLTGDEKALVKVLQEHYNRKADLLENPAQFGNPDARAILPETRHGGSYIPNVYSDTAKALWLERLGGAEGLQEAISRSWLASYAARPAVKARVNDLIKKQIEATGKPATPAAIKEAVEKYAKDKAYGISHTHEFQRSSLIDDGLEGLVGAENNNFLEARHLFDSDQPIMLNDGTEFRVNDLREWDLARITASYDRRVNGDIGIMGATGKDTKALKDEIMKIKTHKGTQDPEVRALQDAIKLLTGRSRRDPDGAMAMGLRSLQDLGFFSKNAYMGVQNLTEIAGMITKGHTRMLLKGIPMLKDMTTWGTKIKPQQLKEMHEIVWGRELDNLIRPKRQDLIDRLRNQGSNEMVAKIMGTTKFITGELSARSPFTKLLTETSNYIADAARQGVLADVVKAVHSGKTPKLFDPKQLHMRSITPEQYAGIKDLVKKHLKKDGKGGYEIVDKAGFAADPRAMHLWRLGDKVADETILRTHKLSSQASVASSPMLNLALQFKNFVLRSVNGRLVRGFYDSTKNGQAIDQVMQAGISMALATSFFVAQSYSVAASMDKEQREAFLKTRLDPNMLGYAALSRSSHIGSPLGVANFLLAPMGFDMARAVRTSVLPRPEDRQPPPGKALQFQPLRDQGLQDLISGGLEQMPGVGYAAGLYQVGVNAAGLSRGEGRRADQAFMTGLYNGLRGVIPNDPASQRLLLALMQEQGMETR